LFGEILDYLNPWDLVVLADSNLQCKFGEVASSARLIFRRRRVILSSIPWLHLSDLGTLVAAYISEDSIIARQIHRHIDQLMKSRYTNKNS